MTDTFTETPLSDDAWEAVVRITEEGMAGEIVDPEDTLSLVFTRADAIALAEFLSFVAVTYNRLPMIAEQVILTVADWEREPRGE